MPTGYTEPLYNGDPITFREFAIRCSRAFGAHIMSRDDGLDVPAPERYEVSTYHREQLARAKARLAELDGMTEDQARPLVDAEYAAAVVEWREDAKKTTERRERYEAMLAQVEAWKPPTSEHESVRTFMREQLTSSIEFDGDLSHLSEPVERSPAEWLRVQREKEEWNVAYHETRLVGDETRTQERNEWIAALLGSLPK